MMSSTFPILESLLSLQLTINYDIVMVLSLIFIFRIVRLKFNVLNITIF